VSLGVPTITEMALRVFRGGLSANQKPISVRTGSQSVSTVAKSPLRSESHFAAQSV
jgi:hypothetical protein